MGLFIKSKYKKRVIYYKYLKLPVCWSSHPDHEIKLSTGHRVTDAIVKTFRRRKRLAPEVKHHIAFHLIFTLNLENTLTLGSNFPFIPTQTA